MKLYTELQSLYPDGHAQRMNLPANTLYLAERAALTFGSDFWVKANEGIWKHCTSHKAAALALEQHWAGGPHAITTKDIDDFLKHQVPVIDGVMKVPSSVAPVIRFAGRTALNTWTNHILAPDSDMLVDPDVRIGLTLLMRMLREALCGKADEKDLDAMIAIANGDDPDELEFRMLMMWLGAPLQQVGRNLQTNFWLLGEMNGVGKGTLNMLMTKIYGLENCATLNAHELERGWTDALNGKLWINVNEMNSKSTKIDYNSFLKQYTTEDMISIGQRNMNGTEVLNFANWLVTSNKERPTCIDIQDRRHFLCATTNDNSKVALSTDLRTWMLHNPDFEMFMLGAFVGILHCQRIDEGLINRAADTPIKTEVRESVGEDSDLEWWLVNDDRYPRDEWHRAGDYVQHFINCFGGGTSLDRNPRNFGYRLAKLARKNRIETRRLGNRSADYLMSAAKYPVADAKSRAVSNSNNIVQITLPQRQV
jgi:Family of unknown function (DUF5906)